MSSSSSTSNTPEKNDNTRLENSTYNILMALGKEADFLYSTIDTYIHTGCRKRWQRVSGRTLE